MTGQKEINFALLIHIVRYQRVATTGNFYIIISLCSSFTCVDSRGIVKAV